MSRQSQQSGFTLVEAVITISIVSIALLAISQALSFGLQHSSDGMGQARTVNLAQAYFEEISAKRFAEATPPGGIPACSSVTTACGSIGSETGETRSTYDDIDDFDGLVDAPPRDAQGNPRPGYDSYSVAIAVRYVTASEVTDLGVDATTDAKRVSVQITPPARDTQEFVAIHGNF